MSVADEGESLVARARTGDRDAFGALVERHYRQIHRTAFYLVGNHEDAEDLTQDCFVRAHRGLSWYRGTGGFPLWLRRILVHLVHDRFRREGRRPLRMPLDAAEQLSPQPEPGETAHSKELTLIVARAVAALPAALRIAFILRAQERLSYEEISEITGVRSATARTQVMKARKALVRVLGSHLEGSGYEGPGDAGGDSQGGRR